jgi:hypothetical protein
VIGECNLICFYLIFSLKIYDHNEDGRRGEREKVKHEKKILKTTDLGHIVQTQAQSTFQCMVTPFGPRSVSI